MVSRLLTNVHGYRSINSQVKVWSHLGLYV